MSNVETPPARKRDLCNVEMVKEANAASFVLQTFSNEGSRHDLEGEPLIRCLK